MGTPWIRLDQTRRLGKKKFEKGWVFDELSSFEVQKIGLEASRRPRYRLRVNHNGFQSCISTSKQLPNMMIQLNHTRELAVTLFSDRNRR